MTADEQPTSDPDVEQGATPTSGESTHSHDDISDTDDAKLPHPPSTATEELDQGVVSETDDGPDSGTSPGVG